MRTLLRFLCLFLAFQIALSACASTKKRDEQNAIGRLWHNMNSHYNGYFNARELMTETLMSIDEQHEDNYTQRLKMFPFLELQNTSAVTENLDIAVEKVAIVVKKHPYSNWVDDSYLLVGQAQLIKQDYESAERTFRFLTTEFRPRPKRSKSKRKKGNKGQAEVSREEEEFVSRREVESDPAQDRKNRIEAQKEARKERERVQKARAKERKQKLKQRKKDIKERQRARKKGIKLPPRTRPDTSARAGLENEPDIVPEEDLGPVGMISIFDSEGASSSNGEAYGKKSGSYLVKHRPAFQDGRLWLAWSLIKRDKFDRANTILEDLRANRGTFSDVRRKAMAVQAYSYLEQEKLEEAIPFLEEAAAVAEERNERARYYYIAGQLYQELGQPAGATGAFERAIAARPDYELELGARLNLAQNSFLSGGGSAADALKKLGRMAKEEKNLPYESQILFSMAAIALRDGDRAAGQDYLKQALASPSARPSQQVESYKILADLAFADGNYLEAKDYYDQTLGVMQRGDQRYAGVEARSQQLTGIAGALRDIQLKDSLLRIAAMPEADRQLWAKDLFERQRQAALDASRQPSVPGAPPGPAFVSTNSDFFAYSPQAVKRGKRDFAKVWGDRPLTDNWRRSSRNTAGELFDDDNDAVTSTEEVSIVTEDEIGKLLENVPVTEEALQQMNIQQATNYFNLGKEYRDQLEDNPRSIEAFETLNRRFPKANGEAESYYYLYLAYKELGNATKAAEYANLLKLRYRGSKYEKLANDPAYAGQLLAEDNKLVREYETAYTTFEAGNFKKAHELAERGRATLIGQHPLKARYALLLAMTTGSTQGRQAYVNALRQVVSQFSGTPEEVRAKEILRLLGESGARLPGRSGSSGGGGNFRETMKEIHYLMVVFRSKDTDLNQAKIKASAFNAKYNKTDRIRVTNVFLGEDNNTPVLVMRRFKSGEAAMEYLNNAAEREQEFLDPTKFDYELLAVSQSNYREVLKSRTIEGYDEWFRENY